MFTSETSGKSSDLTLAYLLKSFLGLIITLGEKQSLTKSYLDQRLGSLSYRQFLWVLSQSHWAGVLVLVSVSLLSYLLAGVGGWAPIWRGLATDTGLDLAFYLTDGRVSHILLMGIFCFSVSFVLGFLGLGRIWFCLLAPGLLFANLISTSLAWSGLFWCWAGAIASVWVIATDRVWRRDLSRLLLLSVLGTLLFTIVAPIARSWLYFSLGGELFHQKEIRVFLWLVGMGVGLIFLSVLHAIFFHFYSVRYQDQKLPMSWNFRMGFFWQVGGARLYRDVLERARTRLAEYQKIAEDLDDETRKKIPLSLVNQWKAELSELEKFTGRRVDVRASFKT